MRGEHMAEPKGINWLEIETRYVMGKESTREIAESIGVCHSIVQHKCADLGWAEKRRKRNTRIAEQIQKKSEDKAISEGLSAAQMVDDALMKHLQALYEDTLQNKFTVYERKINVETIIKIAEYYGIGISGEKKRAEIEKIRKQTAILQSVTDDKEIVIEWVNGDWMNDATKVQK